MYKIKHKETGLYFSTVGHRYYHLLVWRPDKYNEETFLTKHGKVWSTERGPKKIFNFLNGVYPDKFEIVKFVEEK